LSNCCACGASYNYWHHWHHRHNSYSDHWNNGKYHRAIHSYISINGDKHCRNNCHCNYWHHRHNVTVVPVVPVVSVAIVPAVLVTVD
jgi:hypothetical protein